MKIDLQKIPPRTCIHCEKLFKPKSSILFCEDCKMEFRKKSEFKTLTLAERWPEEVYPKGSLIYDNKTSN